MTNEEFERLKESIRAKENDSPHRKPDAKETAEHRKLDRDMDRLERVLKKIAATPMPKRRQRENDDRSTGFERVSRERWAEIRKIGARTDAKLKALIDDLQKKRDERQAS